VLEDFARQAGADLGIQRRQIVNYAKTRRISIDLDQVNFWTALRVLSDRTGLRPQPYASDPQMVLQLNANAMFGGFDMFSDAAKVSGGFLIIPWMCRLNRSVDYERDTEPRLHVIGPSNQEWLQQCLDDQGNSLMGARRPSHFFNNGRGWWWTMQANLKEVPHMGQHIASLRGELKFNLQSKSELIEIADPQNIKDLVKTAGKHTITFKQFANENGQWKLTLSVTNMPARSGPRPAQNFFSMLQVLDAQNQPYSRADMSITGPAQQSEITMRFMAVSNAPMMRMGGGEMEGLGLPKMLRWEVPTETRLVSAPFELTDLALPVVP
jgi:hypothetical protein